ncbi:MAG: Maf family protein [Deltaproteobacteria bacterium]|nr:Maf family protein [Deltaproteobacteria bacterium]
MDSTLPGGLTLRQTRPFCLASASPRRAELLRQLGLVFEVWAAHVDETPLGDESPEEHVQRLALEKGRSAAEKFPGHLILAGDTVVELNGEILGKPEDPPHARRMLRALSSRCHRVMTGYVLWDGPTGERMEGMVETKVWFRELPPNWIHFYTAQAEPYDKAGGYAIQGLGGAMVHHLEGSYTNVVGFPVEAIFWDLLSKGWVVL